MKFYRIAQAVCGVAVILNGTYGLMQNDMSKLAIAAASATMMVVLYGQKHRHS